MLLSKEVLTNEAAKAANNMSNALFEAGKVVGRAEGAADMLKQLAAAADPAPAVEPARDPDLKLAAPGAETGEGQ
jgi:hypothetical protein